MANKRVILYFGSFNPVHNGHISIAEYVLETEPFDELWFVVSPQNPLKSKTILVDGAKRVEMVRLAVEESYLHKRMKVSEVEFELPSPSYTFRTMQEMEHRYEDVQFSILSGSDAAASIEKWLEWRLLLDRYDFYVYPRSGSSVDDRFIVLINAPVFECSSTQIRDMIRRNEDISGLVCGSVRDYIKKNGLWR